MDKSESNSQNSDDYSAASLENYISEKYLLNNDFVLLDGDEFETPVFERLDECGYRIHLSQDKHSDQYGNWLLKYDCSRGSIEWDVNNVEELKTILHSCGAYDVANSLNNLAY